MKIESGFASDLVAEAVKAGADGAEVFMRSSKNLTVEVKGQTVEFLKSSESFGYSLRLIKDGRLGFSYSTDKSDGPNVIHQALDAAVSSDEDPFVSLPGPQPAAVVEVFDARIAEIVGTAGGEKEAEAVALVTAMERAVYERDRRITKVRKAIGSFTSSSTAIVNSLGVKACYDSTSCSGQVTTVAEEAGESQSGWDFGGGRRLRDVSFRDIGLHAADRAVSLLGSRKLSGCRAAVILDNSVTVDFLGILASSLSADAVQKGKSLLAGRLNKRIVSPLITLIDSGLLPGMLGSCPVDDEGVPSQAKTLIRSGELLMYLQNVYTGRKDGVPSTGNAVRGGFSSLPSVGATNLFIDAPEGPARLAVGDMIKSMEKGLYVLDAMGVHTANHISGDFSVGVTGLWVEAGKVSLPVKEAAISGNILDFFSKVSAVGDDLRFYGNVGGPSLLIKDVDISG